MPMVTTCPNCATSFNVEPEVLLSRDGRVRCGQCKQIFDGLLSATTLDEFQTAAGAATSGGARNAEAAPPSAEPAPAAVTATEAATASEPATESATESYWRAWPEAPDVPTPPMPIEMTATALPAQPQSEPAGNDLSPAQASAAVVSLPVPAASEPSDGAAILDTNDPAAPSTNRARWPWAIAASVAALLLAGQVLYQYRSELSAHFPVTKPLLAQLCAWAGCAVPPLQQPAALNIEASDLQVVDKAQPHLVQLTATLRNRAAIDVGYPAFDLVLTDNREHALARRVIVPADYLPSANIANAANATIAANAETTLRIDMDISGLPAAGFRLTLMPAPTH